MSDIILPTKPRKPESYNPRLFILFGRPKSGKSSCAASLSGNLILDLEGGYRALEAMVIRIRNIQDLFAVREAIEEKIRQCGKQPYQRITIDNATRLEEMCLQLAAAKYRRTPMGATFGYKRDKDRNIIRVNGQPVVDPSADVRQLPSGQGWLYIREAVKDVIHMFQPLCQTLILVCHTKDRQVQIDSTEGTELAVDLSGKLGDILCGEADAIGYVYREKNRTIISFDGGGNTLREARPLHLRGKRFVVGESDKDNNLRMDMDQLFIPDKANSI